MPVAATLVAGPAASGKSTLGAALAARTGAVLLDLDTVTNPVLDALGPRLAPSGHWNDAALRPLVRPARYAALLAVASTQVGLGLDVVLVAPFTAELGGGEPWDGLVHALEPADVRVVWLDLPAPERAARMAARGERRDEGVVVEEAVGPVVPHVRVDALSATDEQVEAVVGRSW